MLVTVEREGVLDAFVQTLGRDEPVIEVPIKGSYAPNVFVSALLVRGRVGDVAPTALVDLGKPAYKLGIAEIRVGWAAHELKVKVAPERDMYQGARDGARRRSRCAGRRQPPPTGSEIALAAVDEGLLELLPNKSWKILEAMMARARRGSRNVDRAEAGDRQAPLRPEGGRARAAAAAGGGARELFDTLLAVEGARAARRRRAARPSRCRSTIR